MLKLITTLFDRILFTLSFILGLQAPEFMQQYIQRLSGHLEEVKYQLLKFQTIADLQFNGDLNFMITRYRENTDSAIAQTGEIIGAMNDRLTGFELQLSQLQNNDYLTQLYNFVRQIDLLMAQATLNNFELAVPLEIGALSTGAIFACVVLLLKASTIGILKKIIGKLRAKPTRQLIYPNKKL